MMRIFGTMKGFSQTTLFLMLLLAASSCNTIRYTKLKLVDVNPIRMVKRDVKRSERASYIYVHFQQDSSAIYQVESISVSDTSFAGLIMNTYTDDALYYYKLLKEKAGEDSISRMRLQVEDRKTKLDQLHVWVNDTIAPEIHKNYRVGVSNIRDIEKVKRFDKQWLWAIIGVPIAGLLLFGIFVLTSINKMTYDLNLSMTG